MNLCNDGEHLVKLVNTWGSYIGIRIRKATFHILLKIDLTRHKIVIKSDMYCTIKKARYTPKESGYMYTPIWYRIALN